MPIKRISKPIRPSKLGCTPQIQTVLQHQGYPPIWLDILAHEVPTDIGVHPSAAIEICSQNNAKCEEYHDDILLIIPFMYIDAHNMTIKCEPISIYIKDQTMMTFRQTEKDVLSGVKTRANSNKAKDKGSKHYLYLICDTAISEYHTILEILSSKIISIEEAVHVDKTVIDEMSIYEMKRLLMEFKYQIIPLIDAITKLMRAEWVDTEVALLTDMREKLHTIVNQLDIERSILSDIETFVQTEFANQLGDSMRLLTVISTIFIPLSFIAGVYGMNFDYMPELHMKYGYFMLIGAMGLLMTVMLIVFKLKKYI